MHGFITFGGLGICFVAIMLFIWIGSNALKSLDANDILDGVDCMIITTRKLYKGYGYSGVSNDSIISMGNIPDKWTTEGRKSLQLEGCDVNIGPKTGETDGKNFVVEVSNISKSLCKRIVKDYNNSLKDTTYKNVKLIINYDPEATSCSNSNYNVLQFETK